jgi:Carboxypeptidase regulatory-like domain
MKFAKVSQFRVVVLALFVVLAGAMFGQSSGTGALTGTVTDPSGGSIGGAQVTLTSLATNQVRTATTGANGSYRFTLVPPGSYKVKITANGFKTTDVPSISINVTETPVLDRALEVGAQTEQITVEATAETIQSATSTLGNTVSGTTITELPLVSRNYTQVLNLSAGAVSDTNNGAALGKGTLDMSVNGAGPDQNNFQMDGASIVNAFGAGIAGDSGIYVGIAIPSPDAIAEFKVQTSTFDASYGRNPGANVNVVTKSGTNQLHGSLFEFFRNEDLNANSFFQNRDGGGKQQVLKNNQFGGTIGGPLKKDKLFLFGSYQGTRSRNGIAGGGATSVFLPPIPGGDRSTAAFRSALGAAMCPANHPGNSAYSSFSETIGIPGSVQIACDGSNISPVALNILNVKLPDGSYYMPGSTNGQFQQKSYSIPSSYSGDQYIANFDYVLNSTHTLSGRYLFTEDPQTTAFSISTIPGTPNSSYYANTNALLKLTSLVKSNFVNEARISMQRNIANGADSTPYTPQQVGITPIIPQQTQPPAIIIGGTYNIGGTLAPFYGPATQVQFADQISWSHGKHTIRAGFEYESLQWNLSFKSLLRGFLISPGLPDFLIGRGGFGASGPNTNSPFGAFVACLFCVKSGPDGIIHGYRERDLSWFVQDDFKVNSRLTLNLGVRWEYDGTLGDHYGNLTNVWPHLLQTVPTPPTTRQTSGSSLIGYVVPNNYASHYGGAPPDGVKTIDGAAPSEGGIPKNNYGPRFGFAWRPLDTNRFVVRGGVGLFYDRVGSSKFVHAVEQGDPYALTLDYGGPNPYSLANPFPDTPLGFRPRWFNPATGDNSALNSPFYSVIHTPLSRQYNLGVQYEFAPQWVLEVGFVGSSGINQADYNHNYNTANLASPSHPINGVTTNTIANIPWRVPYLGYQAAGFQGTGYDLVYNYNSMQVTVRKQFARGFMMQAAYTWSKDLSNQNGDGQANSNNANDLWQQYGPVFFSRPQRFILNYSYDIPGKSLKGVAGKVLGDWNLSGVLLVQGGNPLTVNDTGNGSITGTGTSTTPETGTARAQLCPGKTYGTIQSSGGIESRLGGASGGPGYLAPGSFCDAPAIGDGRDFGNSGIGILSGPGQFNWDTSLVKTMKLTERQSVQLRAEFFNILNHPNFGAPSLNRNTANTFGVINSTVGNPRLIQFALKYRF